MQTGSGTLFVVATPIGNLDDISVRAREVLAGVVLIAAEDTRRSGKLLNLLGIRNRLMSCHEHNESERVGQIIDVLAAGDDVALVSDAGTPLLSDPGFRVVSAVAAEGYAVSPVPGPSALAAAVSVAGLPTDSVLFAGFLPASQGKRSARLESLASRTETLVLYESVHRIRDTIADLITAFGEGREAVAARELTKMHETIYRGALADIATQLDADAGAAKGEYTLVIAGAADEPGDDADLDRVLQVLLGYLGVRQAAEAAAKLMNVRKNDAYKRALQLREDSDDKY